MKLAMYYLKNYSERRQLPLHRSPNDVARACEISTERRISMSNFGIPLILGLILGSVWGTCYVLNNQLKKIAEKLDEAITALKTK